MEVKLGAKSFERKRRIMSIVETLKEMKKKGRELLTKEFIRDISLTYFIDERKASEYLRQAKYLARWKDA